MRRDLQLAVLAAILGFALGILAMATLVYFLLPDVPPASAAEAVELPKFEVLVYERDLFAQTITKRNRTIRGQQSEISMLKGKVTTLSRHVLSVADARRGPPLPRTRWIEVESPL